MVDRDIPNDGRLPFPVLGQSLRVGAVVDLQVMAVGVDGRPGITATCHIYIQCVYIKLRRSRD